MESEREGSPNESNANVDLEKNKLRFVLLLFDARVAGTICSKRDPLRSDTIQCKPIYLVSTLILYGSSSDPKGVPVMIYSSYI